MRALALGDEGAWLEESTADGSIVAQLAAQSEGLREALGDFRAAAAELPGEVLAQSSVVAAAQVTQDVGEVRAIFGDTVEVRRFRPPVLATSEPWCHRWCVCRRRTAARRRGCPGRFATAQRART